ncbi:MAG: hypothetical protein ACRDRT_11700, partial [Pseudonocardiaceae bacterium]
NSANPSAARPIPEAAASPPVSTPLGAVNGLDIPPLPGLVPELAQTSIPNLGNRVTDSVDTITGTVGGALGGLVPTAKPSPQVDNTTMKKAEPLTITTLVAPKPKAVRKNRPEPTARAATAASELTGAVGGLLK